MRRPTPMPEEPFFITGQFLNTFRIAILSAPPSQDSAAGRRKKERRAFTSMFRMRSDQAPLQKHGIEKHAACD